jgi:hypothetical protein
VDVEVDLNSDGSLRAINQNNAERTSAVSEGDSSVKGAVVGVAFGLLCLVAAVFLVHARRTNSNKNTSFQSEDAGSQL